MVPILNMVFAQQKIMGKVSDEKGNPIENVTVTEVNTKNLTQTKEGRIFSLTLRGNFQTASLMFTKLGVKKPKIPDFGIDKLWFL